MFDPVSAVLNVVFFVLIIYLISRVAHFMKDVKSKLNEIDRKIEEIKETTAKND
ncbi:hypothetical protein RGU12_19925 [Fredinandcohnia sp. QZ13]|uniref:hypothetical protein n=1 Tax=Fredinandcohnia sp. QZ13 TaxID=3073144 RepID=UPI0028534F94|nr:hypothetical protein [Fredinandcohnia sp. QZ13]MDR4889766.1 hypothetical protein [Fredinandcohnia sp. QZ13]